MFAKLRKSKAQTTAEYAILIALVVGAAMAMQIYVRRGLQGRVKDVVDHTGSGGEVGAQGDQLTFSSSQYEPYYLTSQSNTTQSMTNKENVAKGGVVARTAASDITTSRDQTILPSGGD